MAAPSALILINDSAVFRNQLKGRKKICTINSGHGKRGLWN
jgi:hypothetical protein